MFPVRTSRQICRTCPPCRVASDRPASVAFAQEHQQLHLCPLLSTTSLVRHVQHGSCEPRWLVACPVPRASKTWRSTVNGERKKRSYRPKWRILSRCRVSLPQSRKCCILHPAFDRTAAMAPFRRYKHVARRRCSSAQREIERGLQRRRLRAPILTMHLPLEVICRMQWILSHCSVPGPLGCSALHAVYTPSRSKPLPTCYLHSSALFCLWYPAVKTHHRSHDTHWA